MKTFFKTINFAFKHFTLAKLLGGLCTALIIASLKYSISGSFHIEYSDFKTNFGLALVAWTLNTGIIAYLSEILGIKGINFNLYQLFYGFHTINGGDESTVKDFKPKLYNAMESDNEKNSDKPLDKGKGVDKQLHPNHWSITSGSKLDESKPIDKTQEVDNTRPTDFNTAIPNNFSSGADLASLFTRKVTNPGPGFNVPGDEVPIRDAICQHIDYNTHILNQFKKMDLETATEQRNNNLLFIKVIETKLEYAKNTLSKVPTIPTTEYEFRLKNQILRDLDSLNKDKVRAEARATLLSSRIQFIENNINKN